MKFYTVALAVAALSTCVMPVLAKPVLPFGVASGSSMTDYEEVVPGLAAELSEDSGTPIRQNLIRFPTPNPMLSPNGLIFLTGDGVVCGVQGNRTFANEEAFGAFTRLHTELAKRYPTIPSPAFQYFVGPYPDDTEDSALSKGEGAWFLTTNEGLPDPLDKISAIIYRSAANETGEATLELVYYFKGFAECGPLREAAPDNGAGL